MKEWSPPSRKTILIFGERRAAAGCAASAARPRAPEEAHILETPIYSAGFQFYRYGFGAAFAAVTFLILLGFSVLYIRVNRATQALYE